MGLQRTVEGIHQPLIWEQLIEKMKEQGMEVQLRMIDGLPAFPDEIPQSGYKELRFSTANGMLTLRFQAKSIEVVVWGNSPPNLVADQENIAKMIAELTGGIGK